MKVLLIVPSIHGGRARLVPTLSVVTVAALTPSDIEVSVIDENVERINFDAAFDLVGITVMTSSANRSYELANIFQKKGSAVVLGGVHPSLMPDEAIQHCDSVVIGEAEGVWPKLLRDFEYGKLQKFYQRETPACLENQPIPRRDLLRPRAYKVMNTVETGRGCPFRCNYCSVTTFFGNTYRFRPVKDVIQEVANLKGKLMFFVDNNIIGSLSHSKELFRALIPYDKRWIGQASLTLARDKELLKLTAKSGCIGLFIGFESISQESLREAGKTHNIVKRYEEDIKMIRDNGIAINGAFIFGFDNDDESVFERTVDFVKRNKLDSATFAALTPFPGTPLYYKLDKENRIVTKDWTKYGGAVFKPKLMSLETLDEGCKWAWRECYSYKSILGRLAAMKRYWHIHFLLNLGYKISLM